MAHLEVSRAFTPPAIYLLPDAALDPVKSHPRPRTVFGRRTAIVDGAEFKFEMRKDGVVLWRKRTRKKHLLTFAQMADSARGQMQLL